MKIITVQTGFGYFADTAGHVIAFARLPAGDHPCKDGYDYIEVASQAELDQIQIWIDPAVVITAEREKLIYTKQRQIAITALIAEGKLPVEFKDMA